MAEKKAQKAKPSISSNTPVERSGLEGCPDVLPDPVDCRVVPHSLPCIRRLFPHQLGVAVSYGSTTKIRHPLITHHSYATLSIHRLLHRTTHTPSGRVSALRLAITSSLHVPPLLSSFLLLTPRSTATQKLPSVLMMRPLEFEPSVSWWRSATDGASAS